MSAGQQVNNVAHKDPTEIDESAIEDMPTTEEVESEGIRWKMAITAGVLGLIIGGFAAWATANLGIAAIAFIAGFAGGGYFLYQKDMPSEAIGSGLYITALVMILTPLLFYLPAIAGGGGNGAEEAGAFIGSVMGIVIWGFVFLLFAIVTGAVGYFFKRRARKKRDESVA